MRSGLKKLKTCTEVLILTAGGAFPPHHLVFLFANSHDKRRSCFLSAPGAAFLRRRPRHLVLLTSAVTVGVATFSALLGPHTFLQSWARDVLQHHTLGMRTRITGATEKLVREVMEDAEFTAGEMGRTSAYLCYQQETMSLGSVDSHCGLLLGFPEYVQTGEVDLNKIRLKNKPLPQSKRNSPEAEMLRDSMSLSDGAKRFLIARELARGRKGGRHRRILALESVAFVVATFHGCRLAEEAVGGSLFRRMRWARPVFYLVSCGAAVALFVLLRDLQRLRYEAAYDADACSLGAAYAAGGVEFYEKALQRHRAMRALMEAGEGASQFTMKGDLVPGLLRAAKHRPLSLRKEDCERILEETREEKEQ